jgi:hypothetical protein
MVTTPEKAFVAGHNPICWEYGHRSIIECADSFVAVIESQPCNSHKDGLNTTMSELVSTVSIGSRSTSKAVILGATESA